MSDTKKMLRAKQMAPDERKQHLLGIAIKVFADKGLDGARHGDIAKAAGVSIPTVHSYFKTRTDLVSSVLNEVRRYVVDECTIPYIDGASLEERMMASGLNLGKRVATEPEYIKVWIMWGAYFAEPFKSQFEDYENEAIGYLCQLISGDANSANDDSMREKARVLVGLSMFLAQMMLRGENEERQKTFMQNVMQTLQIWI